MGQKVNPALFRLGTKLLNTWNFVSYVGKKSASDILKTNLNVRGYINKACSQAQISKISIKVFGSKFVIDIHCRKPGIIIGSSGAGIEKMKNEILKIINKESVQLVINVAEVKNSDINATLVANSIAAQLERRVSFRKVMKKAVQTAMKSGAKGVKISCSGRLAGVDIARTEKYMEGTVPLHTLRANVDYALAEAKTTYGVTGVKVWIHVDEKAPYRRLINKPKKTSLTQADEKFGYKIEE
jgi:small subunit ribosomal protein S3